ncbi:hypothetical protein [Acidovorax sp.]|uniref:hypothetical protein n=1 Tax=Acidovorax sp. TaxID=1872122 RepID=UPI00391B09FB
MFFTVCSRSQQSFNDCMLSDSNQPEAVLGAAVSQLDSLNQKCFWRLLASAGSYRF